MSLAVRRGVVRVLSIAVALLILFWGLIVGGASMAAIFGRETPIDVLPLSRRILIAGWQWSVRLLPFALIAALILQVADAFIGRFWRWPEPVTARDRAKRAAAAAVLAGGLPFGALAIGIAGELGRERLAGGLAVGATLTLLLFLAGFVARTGVALLPLVPLGKALAAVVCASALGVLAAEIWARPRLSAYEAAWRLELAQERALAAAGVPRRPVLRGDALTENAAPRYRALFEELRSLRDPGLSRAASAGPGVPLSAESKALLAQHRERLARLQEALRCDRIDWDLRYEDGYGMEIPPLMAARNLAHLSVLEGHEYAQAGALAGAAERYLGSVRLGSDLSVGNLSGVLIMDLIGMAVARPALDSLGLLVTSSDPSKLPLTRIASGLSQLQPVLPDGVRGYRGQRLDLATLPRVLRGHPEQQFSSDGHVPLLVRVLPSRPLAAHAIGVLEPLFRELEKAAAQPDPAEYERVVRGLLERAAADWDPIPNWVLLPLVRARISTDELRASFALTAAAVRVEQARTGSTYPADLAALDPPADPHAWPAKIHYRRSADGSGYKLWSVGNDHSDDGGEAGKDQVLERRDRQ